MLRTIWVLALTLFVTNLQPAQAGWPFFSEDGVRRGSEEYYELHANDPIGQRRRYHHGLWWPIQPRPVGPPQPFIHKYYWTHAWPYPYECWDRGYVNQIWGAQILSGWQAATTLFDYHFDPETQELNSSGLMHLRWIAVHVPEQYRQAYVATAADPSLNSLRLLNVEREMSKLTGGDQTIPVALRTTTVPLGRPAGEVQRIFTASQDNMIAPVIRYVSPTGTGN